MKTLFLTPGPITWASARMRAYWPARYIPGSTVMAWDGQAGIPSGYDNYIFVKRADADIMRQIRETGARVYYDVCDPTWWWSPAPVRNVIANVDGVVCSNQALANDFIEWSDTTPIVIPDRLELEHFPKRRQHEPVDVVRFVWFGAHQNRIAVFGGLVHLERLAANGHNIALTICDDRPDIVWSDLSSMFPIYYVRWRLDQENEILASHDVAYLPPYPGEWGRVKSNNRQLTAWACGLPALTDERYPAFERIMSWTTRTGIAGHGLDIVLDDGDVSRSAAQWISILGAQL